MLLAPLLRWLRGRHRCRGGHRLFLLVALFVDEVLALRGEGLLTSGLVLVQLPVVASTIVVIVSQSHQRSGRCSVNLFDPSEKQGGEQVCWWLLLTLILEMVVAVAAVVMVDNKVAPIKAR